MKNVLVYGATGDQGIPLINRLLQAGFDVRAVSRKPDEDHAGFQAGVETVYGDFADLDSLIAASRGMDAVAMNLPFVYDVEFAQLMGHNIVSAAKAAGLTKVVFNTSCVDAGRDLGVGAHEGRRRIIETIKDSGLDYTVLCPTVFLDNLTRSWIKPSIVRDGVFAYPAADNLRVSWVSIDDVARCMVAALQNPECRAEQLTVGGAETLTGHELAEVIGRASGRAVTYRSIDPDEFAASMSYLITRSREVPPNSIYAGMAKFYRWYNSQPQSPVAVSRGYVESLLGITLSTATEWAQGVDWTA